MYVFISVRRGGTEVYVVPSRVVAKNVRVERWGAFTRYSWVKQERYLNAWDLLR